MQEGFANLSGTNFIQGDGRVQRITRNILDRMAQSPTRVQLPPTRIRGKAQVHVLASPQGQCEIRILSDIPGRAEAAIYDGAGRRLWRGGAEAYARVPFILRAELGVLPPGRYWVEVRGLANPSRTLAARF